MSKHQQEEKTTKVNDFISEILNNIDSMEKSTEEFTQMYSDHN